MSDIQEEQKRLYKKAEENDIDAYKMYRKIQEQAKVYEEYDNFDREDLIDELEEEKRINEYNLEEINRLNNIIDELENRDNILEEFEKWLEEQKYRNSEWDNFVSDGVRIGIPRQYIIDKLNELKGDNK